MSSDFLDVRIRLLRRGVFKLVKSPPVLCGNDGLFGQSRATLSTGSQCRS